MEQLTGYKQMAAQLRWLKQQFDIEPARRADGLPVLSYALLESLLHKRSGLSLPADATSANKNWFEVPGVNFTKTPRG